MPASRRIWLLRSASVFGAAVLGLAFALGANASAQDAPLVAAASDLNFALEEIARKFRADTGREVRLAFGSSGNFTRSCSRAHHSRCSFRRTKASCSSSPTPARPSIAARSMPKAASCCLHRRLPAQGRRHVLGPARGARRRPHPAFRHRQPEHAPYGRAAEQALKARVSGTRSGPSWCWARTFPRQRSSPPPARRRVASSPIRSPFRQRLAGSEPTRSSPRNGTHRCASAWYSCATPARRQGLL